MTTVDADLALVTTFLREERSFRVAYGSLFSEDLLERITSVDGAGSAHLSDLFRDGLHEEKAQAEVVDVMFLSR